MKKVLVLSSSPRKGGNSDILCDEFVRGAKDAGCDVTKIFLKDKTANKKYSKRIVIIERIHDNMRIF